MSAVGDLERTRAIEERIRTSSDEDVARFLGSADGAWFCTVGQRYAAMDVIRRIACVIVELPVETFLALVAEHSLGRAGAA